DARADEGGGELDETRLVAHRDEGPADRDDVPLAIVGWVVGRTAHSSFTSMCELAMSSTAWMSRRRSTGLMRSCRVPSVSPGSTGMRSWEMIGPLSTPLSTTMTLAP